MVDLLCSEIVFRYVRLFQLDWNLAIGFEDSRMCVSVPEQIKARLPFEFTKINVRN